MAVELPALDLDPDVRLQQLLEASRGIVLDTLPLSSTRLSRFTLRQMAKEATPRRKPRPKEHYKTRRKRFKAENLTKGAKYRWYKSHYGEAWMITLEEWDVLWDFIGGARFKLGRYRKDEPLTMETVWIEDSRTRRKLWEGYEDRLRGLGLLL